MSKTNKIMFFVMVLIGAIIVYFEIRKLNFSESLNILMATNWGYIILAVLLMLLSWTFESLILKVCLDDEQYVLPFRDAYRVTLIEQGFNAITPMATGGQPAQLVALLQSGVEGGRASSVLLLKFIAYQFIVLLNFVLALAIGFEEVSSHFGGLAILIVFGLVMHVVVVIILSLIMFKYSAVKQILAFVAFICKPFMKPENLVKFENTLDSKAKTFHMEGIKLKTQKKRVLYTSLLTFVQLGLYYSVPYFIILAFGITNVSFISVFVMQIMIVMIVSLFPIPGGAGGAEFTFSTLFKTYISSQNKLVLAMLLWRFCTYYFGMFLGIGSLGIKQKGITKR